MARKTLRPIRPPVAIEREYHKRLKRLIREMDRSLYYWLRAEYRKNETVIADASERELRRKMQTLLRKWRGKFKEESEDLAKWFGGSIQNFTKRNIQNQFKRIAKSSPVGFDLDFKYTSRKERGVFNAIVQQNVSLIKSIAEQHLTNVEGVVLRGIENGLDLSTMTSNLEQSYGVTERRAAIIARDQTAKATNSLSRVRLLTAGLTQGKWIHTSAGKTYRDSHVEMDGEIYELAQGCYDEDYGDYIQPAELVNCHCTFAPVLPDVGGGDIDS